MTAAVTGRGARSALLQDVPLARHVTRAQRLRVQLHLTGGMSSVDEVLVLSREVARTTGRVAVDPAGLRLRLPRPRAA